MTGITRRVQQMVSWPSHQERPDPGRQTLKAVCTKREGRLSQPSLVDLFWRMFRQVGAGLFDKTEARLSSCGWPNGLLDFFCVIGFEDSEGVTTNRHR